MANGVLHERLDAEMGQQSGCEGGRHCHLRTQAICESQFLYVEVAVRELHLLFEAYLLNRVLRQQGAHHFAELCHRVDRSFRSIRANKGADRVERVEEEVRPQLHLEAAKSSI